jgi:hypothetical protein
MTGNTLEFSIALQCCLIATAALIGLKNPQRVTVAERDGMTPVPVSSRELQPATSMPEGLCDASLRIRRQNFLAWNVRIVP